MELIEEIKQIRKPYKNSVITIGNFDGVHKGHQALFKEAINKASSIGGTSLAVTFDPHPLKILRPDKTPPLITLYEQKVELIAQTGLDVLICIKFTKEFSEVTAKEFLEDILIKRLGMKAIIVGNDYHFGKNREGNIDFLQSFSKIFNFELIIPSWINVAQNKPDRISSTRIRDFVSNGNIEESKNLLGRYYQIRGFVEEGRKRGKELLGIPTANIRLSDELCPKIGVYAVIVELDGNKYKGVANIGYSPTFTDNVFTVEVHILDFDKDIYGKKIYVNFVSQLREEKKFTSLSDLSAQIKKDIQSANELLSL
ncbi:MAG: bifunctional riboflavin kinase/FAD synthetase [Desulfobacterales bacterium]|nr:bifunctional riboflavin kinase/FAD synthetase [Desulfobacterales bacterium]